MDEEHPPDTKDFRTFLIKLRKRPEVEAIFVNLYLGQVGLFAKQARELGVNIPLINVETFEDANEIKISNGALVGQWYVQSDEASPEFLEEFRKRWPSTSTFVAGNCADAIKLIGAAMRETNPVEQFLAQVKDFPGVMGSFSATGDNRFTLPATIKIVTEKGFKKYGAGRSRRVTVAATRRSSCNTCQ